MKSLQTYITEKRNTISVEVDGSPNWGYITPGVLESGEACIIIGEPCSRKKAEEWLSAYDTAKKMGLSVRNIADNIDDAFAAAEQDLGIELDEQECLCIVYLPEDSTLSVFTYQSGGVYAIK